MTTLTEERHCNAVALNDPCGLPRRPVPQGVFATKGRDRGHSYIVNNINQWLIYIVGDKPRRTIWNG